MSKNNFINLIKKLNGQLSAKDKQVLEKDAEKIWQASSAYKKDYQPNVEQGLSRLKARMQAAEPAPKIVPMRRRHTGLLRAAAAVLLLIGAGFLWQYMQASPDVLVAETSAGETKIIQLVDGSSITLNENSALSYPTAFTSQERKVRLQGEAFFDIQKKPSQPFRIETDYTYIEVLGTSFNVRALDSESTTEVAVSTGKVQFTDKKSKESLILVKTEKGVCNQKSQVLRKVEQASGNELSWMHQKLAFKKIPLATVIQDLERHFDVDIQLDNAQLENCPYTSLFNPLDVDKILSNISSNFSLELNKTSASSYQLIGGACK